MSTIEANITLDLPDGADFSTYIQMVERIISELTGKPTKINIQEIDDPLSTNIVGLSK